MRHVSPLIAITFLVFAMFAAATTTHPTFAALPCNMQHPVEIELPEGSGEPVPSDPRPLGDILQSDEAADRDGATELTYDDGALRANVVGVGENVLRCLDYGQDRVLIDNATANFTSDRFDPADIAIGRDLIEHGSDGGVYTDSVSNPLELADGRFLVDFVVRHDGNWLSGEMVFERFNGEFYLDSSHLATVEPAEILVAISVTEGGLADDSITVSANTDIQLVNETEDDITLIVTSQDDDSEVFRSEITPENLEGPALRDIVPASKWSPGEFTATIQTADGSQHVVTILVSP